MGRRPKLTLQTKEKTLSKTASFRASPGQFESHGVKIDEEGVEISDKVKHFDGIPYDELTIDTTIGRGASSTVRLATHSKTGQRFALKCINMWDKSKRNQLLSELHTLYVSDCAALVQFYGATFHEGEVAVTLEYMDLGGLDNVVAKFGRIPENVLACMAFQVLWGLAYLKHEKRVHRDIKPPNILANSKGQVKLTDFGISKELQDSIMCQTFVGSFKYMAPERMQHIKYDYSADIWSLGIVLMECAVGKYPYPESTSAIGYVHSVTEGDVPTLPEDMGFSDEFVDFLSHLVTKDKDDRLPADVLLAAPWLVKNGAESIDSAVAVVKEWLSTKDLDGADPAAEKEGGASHK